MDDGSDDSDSDNCNNNIIKNTNTHYLHCVKLIKYIRLIS